MQIIFANSKYYEVTGIPRTKGIAGPQWVPHLYEEDLATVVAIFEKMEATKERTDFQVKLRPLPGHEISKRELWIKASMIPMTNSDGTIRATMGTVIDVSSFRFAEAQQKLRADEALQAKRDQENVSQFPCDPECVKLRWSSA